MSDEDGKVTQNTREKMRSIANPSFRFIVDFGGNTEGVFTECTLPVIEFEVEEVKEGGVNDYIHQLPGRRKSARITLKNGVGSSEMAKWFFGECLQGQISRRNLSIKLVRQIDPAKDAIMDLKIDNAFPIKWTGPQLKSDDNSIAIQTIELSCGKISVETH